MQQSLDLNYVRKKILKDGAAAEIAWILYMAHGWDIYIYIYIYIWDTYKWDTKYDINIYRRLPYIYRRLLNIYPIYVKI